MARVILGYRPPLELADRDFKATPLGWAIHGSEHGWNCGAGNYAGTVEALLQAGAKPSEKIEGSRLGQRGAAALWCKGGISQELTQRAGSAGPGKWPAILSSEPKTERPPPLKSSFGGHHPSLVTTCMVPRTPHREISEATTFGFFAKP